MNNRKDYLNDSYYKTINFDRHMSQVHNDDKDYFSKYNDMVYKNEVGQNYNSGPDYYDNEGNYVNYQTRNLSYDYYDDSEDYLNEDIIDYYSMDNTNMNTVSDVTDYRSLIYPYNGDEGMSRNRVTSQMNNSMINGSQITNQTQTMPSGRMQPTMPRTMPNGGMQPTMPGTMPNGGMQPTMPGTMPGGGMQPTMPGTMPNGGTQPINQMPMNEGTTNGMGYYDYYFRTNNESDSNGNTMDNEMIQECKGIVYTVKKGDTLYNISRRYNVPLDLIMDVNPVTDVYNLQVGMKLCVPVMQQETGTDMDIFRGGTAVPRNEGTMIPPSMPLTTPSDMQTPIQPSVPETSNEEEDIDM